ncbi:hypothetical protein KVT40_003396 [Elsinoe batatas]|uniref:Saccharopine dehydrogenase-like C-terminal domain-containing protein n=1 Tax=Elsinoe batatas TaxID=2601811 RepID=A0A8K0L430_9PEZI|nr:hypothetical protein KVT40_003396 [Elsinoe batatas]
MSKAEPYHVKEGHDFVAYPNRDSTPFRDFYKIPEADTIIRGSLRFHGNPEFVDGLRQLGWLDATPKDWLVSGMTWLAVHQRMMGTSDSREITIVNAISSTVKWYNAQASDDFVTGLRQLGLLSHEIVPVKDDTLLDTLCAQLEKRLSFLPGERDLVILQHKFVIEKADGSAETRTSTLEMYGDPQGYSAMAKSVGVTCGIATQLIIERHPLFNKPGVHAPYDEQVCHVLREAVEKEGITMIEETHR